MLNMFFNKILIFLFNPSPINSHRFHLVCIYFTPIRLHNFKYKLKLLIKNKYKKKYKMYNYVNYFLNVLVQF